jgi:cation:H+ antiporter
MIEQVLIFSLGILCLWKGGDYLVDGASGLASKLGIAPFIIGLTVVAFGTSAPELAVNVISSLNGTSDITFGNILGSNLSNLLLILGISSIIYPITVSNKHVKIDVPISILCAIALMAFVTLPPTPFILTHIESIFLLIGFLAFIGLAVKEIKQNSNNTPSSTTQTSSKKLLLLTLGGILLLPLGGKWVTQPAINMAQALGVSQTYIALFSIAIGTSLPELVTSVSAALKKETDIAFGNIIGSNIFNILLILGISGLIAPISFNPILLSELWFIIAISIGIIFFAKNSAALRINRVEGSLLFLAYIAYIVFATIRG